MRLDELVPHLSSSSIRAANEDIVFWFGKYGLKIPDEAGPGAWRGLAVEAGVDRLLFGDSAEAANNAMQTEWDNKAQGVADDAALKEYGVLPWFLAQASLAFADHAPPFQRQARISLEIPGIPVPLIGFADWVWKAPDCGTDLKTTHRIPSVPDPWHIAQVAAYSRAFDGCPFSLTYVSSKKWVRYEISPDQMTEGWERLVEGAHALQSLLAHCEDVYDALSMFSPDYNSFRMSPAMAEGIRAAKAQRRLL
jgi:hypothetical protein